MQKQFLIMPLPPALLKVHGLGNNQLISHVLREGFDFGAYGKVWVLQN